MKLNPTINWSVVVARINAIAGLFTFNGMALNYIPKKYAEPIIVIAMVVQCLTENVAKPSGIVRPIE